MVKLYAVNILFVFGPFGLFSLFLANLLVISSRMNN